ncbi:MAG: hypothetical protein LJE85_01415 [Gammaproteobacteria bacterium]|jgi:hypothetical protein|nr:hypothetical protein [Gammaproteobacteria bacterium]
MKAVLVIIFLAVVLAVPGCSKETVKRATYGSAQLYGKQQCEQEFSADCPEPDSYEEYQRKRKELQEDE